MSDALPLLSRSVGSRPVAIRAAGFRFALVFAVVNLHTLRRLAEMPYLLLYASVLALVVLDLGRSRPALRVSSFGYIYLWVALAGFGFLVSAVISGPSAAAYGLSRFLFALPVLLALIAYTDSEAAIRRHVTVMCIFAAVAAMSVPFQTVVGPVAWFAEASERGGEVRYGSLFGSIVVLGSVSGLYVILSNLIPALLRWPIIIMIAIGAASSLSKSAALSLTVGLIVLVALNARRLGKLTVELAFVLGALLTLLALFDQLRQRVLVPLASYGLAGTGVLSDDVAIGASIHQRLVDLPLENLQGLAEIRSPLVYLTGGGFGMASTALVPEANSLAMMSHNMYVEILTVFGIVGGAVVLWLLFRILTSLLRRTRMVTSEVYPTLLVTYVVLLAGGMFENGRLYHPASASVLYLCFFAAISTGLGSQELTKTRPLRRLPHGGIPDSASAPETETRLQP